MLQKIRTSKAAKVVVCYLSMMMIIETVQPIAAYAMTSGPTQPEFNSFTPISTSDMVDLSSGNFNYNIPIMDVGGYPLNLSYDSSITMDQEASWTGLGWNLNVGQIHRQVRGLPDDFKGDEMRYENDLRDNVTIGTTFNYHPAFFGVDANGAPLPHTAENASFPLGIGLGVQYNNYEGITFKPSFGVSFELSDNVSVGANFSSSVGEGASVSPSISMSRRGKEINGVTTTYKGTVGVDFNSRKGLENINLSANVSSLDKNYIFAQTNDYVTSSAGTGGRISLNNTNNYTPTKRVAYDNANLTFNAALGTEIFGGEGQGQLVGYGSYQGINNAYKNRKVKAFGYENTHQKGTQEGVLDFNRENERTVSKNTTVLPVTNYTYDIYSIDGQGVSGMFRPFRSQVTYVYNDDVTDYGIGASFGAEIGFGNLVHGGINFLVAPSTSTTGKWIGKNNALPAFTDNNNHGTLYEQTAYKMIGEFNTDDEKLLYNDKIIGENPVRIKLSKSRYDNKAMPIFQEKTLNTAGVPQYTLQHSISKIERTKRFRRSQVIQKITSDEARYDKQVKRSTLPFVQPHHTAGMKVYKTDGSTYVYGQAAYNVKKVEATFDVSNSGLAKQYDKGTVTVTSRSGNNSARSDKFLNRVTTPAYAHDYLLTSILSPDYQDINNDGPSIGDLGNYTQFEYIKNPDPSLGNYKWRVPYQSNISSYNEGLKSNGEDEKANYLYGEKELVYLKKIKTKTHVAVFHISKREDARGAQSEIGSMGGSAAYTYKLDSIRLYSVNAPHIENLDNTDPDDDVECIPIKTAHFEYDYQLCKGTPNSLNVNSLDLCNHDPNNDGNHDDDHHGKGKLTLTKVYFTYKNSKMGVYTPYKFTYSSFNPCYHMRENDVWGNYKPQDPTVSNNINSPLGNAEYPFVEQEDKIDDNDTHEANIYSGAWVLKSVSLPSGGIITVDTESDDYQYVQDHKAMQMYKVVGSGDQSAPSGSQLTSNDLYDGNNHDTYIYVDLGPGSIDDVAAFKQKFLAENEKKPIYFRFLLNMAGGAGSQKYDYVSGYFKINESGHAINVWNSGGRAYAAIPLKTLDRDGGTGGNKQVNPIAKAGWSFGRTYLNRVVYSLGGDSSNGSFVSIVKDLVGSIGAITELWKGPNKALQDKGCAKYFKPEKSWVRLENAIGRKYGGGLRVKKIQLSDNWNVMSSHNDNTIYDQQYGQEFNYNLPDQTSSGVATYEPNASPENPLVEPFYADGDGYADKIASPKESNYVEKPFGEAFYPSPKVTYSMITVSNLKPVNSQDSGAKVTKHATGRVVTEYFTSKDFPTISDYTDIDMAYDEKNPVLSFLNILSIDHLVASQGFSIESNDMDGKIKKQSNYAEDGMLVSSMEYKYNTNSDGKTLDNTVDVISPDGKVEESLIGVDYDMINDFNESISQSGTLGFDGNLAVMIYGIWPTFVPVILPKVSYNENLLRTAVTTKVIHKKGILVEMIARDGASTVSTKNLAWDGHTGQCLLTQTVNEFNDSYYSLTFPAYWNYSGMGMASENIDASGNLFHAEQVYPDKQGYVLPGVTDITTVFRLGDELSINRGLPTEILLNVVPPDEEEMLGMHIKAWVVGFSADKTQVYLMNEEGDYIDPCGFNENPVPFKVMRSGNRNLHMAGMASITCLKNPITTSGPGRILNLDDFEYDGSGNNLMVINAGAVTYNDFWRNQEEYGQFYPTFEESDDAILEDGSANFPQTYSVNPYLHNIKGNWRAKESFAYLTGRNVATATRKTGFYTSFSPFYKIVSDKWVSTTDDPKWTSASSVTQFSPFGMELENKDALGRYTAAQYGYANTLPMAVASNSEYREILFEGFEETGGNARAGFKDDTGVAIELTTDQAHTGKKSIPVVPGGEAIMAKNMAAVTGTKREPYRCLEQGILCPPAVEESNTVDVIDNHRFCLDLDGPYHFEIILDFGADGPSDFDATGIRPLTFSGYPPTSLPTGFSYDPGDWENGVNPRLIYNHATVAPWTLSMGSLAIHLIDGTGSHKDFSIDWNMDTGLENATCREANIGCLN